MSDGMQFVKLPAYSSTIKIKLELPIIRDSSITREY